MHIEYKEVLENVQEKSVKMVAGLTSSTNGDRCAELGLEKTRELEGNGRIWPWCTSTSIGTF